ncbi:hypothetical protein CN563_24510 [Bacillus sp. AFS026049]|nr:hypothetical protein CN563_24510 [Bacillus sp. AFS026049]
MCFKRKNCWLVLFQTLFKTRLFFIFFPVILNGWKKYATLLPKNWLAGAPQLFTVEEDWQAVGGKGADK